MATTPIPQMNPTGVIGSGSGNTMPGQQGTGFSSFSGTGGPGNMGFGNGMNPNPTAAGANPFIQAAQTNPGGMGGTTGTVTSEGSTTATANPYGQSQSQQQWTEKYLQETYGGGMGSLIYQYLMSNGGYNSALTGQVVGAQTNAMRGQTQLGLNSLESGLSAMGVSGSSSEMGDAASSFLNTATTQENAITSQEYYNMWNQSQQNELSMMQFAATGTAKTLANKPNLLDWLTLGSDLGPAVRAVQDPNSGSSSSGGSSGGGMSQQEMMMLMMAAG